MKFLIMIIRAIRDKAGPVFATAKADDVRDALNGIVARSIAPMALGLAIFYLLYGFLDAWARAGEAWGWVVLLHFIAAILLTGLWWYVRNFAVPARRAHPLAGGVAFLILLVSLIQLALLGQSGASITILLLIIGMGCFLLSFGWWAGLTAGTALVWALVAPRLFPREASVYFAYQMMAAVLVSFVVLAARCRRLAQLHRLRIHAERHEKEMEKAIQTIGHYQERFEKLSEISFEGVAVCENEIIQGANHTLARIVGKPLPQLIGGSLSDFIAPGSLNAVQAHLREGRNKVLEARGRRCDGSEFPMEFQSRSLRTDPRNVRLVALRDMTRQKSTDQALRTAQERANSAQARAALAKRELETFKRKNQEFVAKADQFQQELAATKAELVNALKRARELEEKMRLVEATKNRLLSAICQEVHTPMEGILGMADLVLESASDPNQRELVKMMKGSGRALLGAVNEFHDFSRIETGALSLSAQEFSLPELIEDTVESFGRAAFEKGLSIEVLIKNGLPVEVVGDAERARQILANLLSNAIKFTDEGEVFVQAALTRETESTAEVLVEVRDTGGGIPPEAQSRLFQSFAPREESATPGNRGGAGLGLALARKLAELMEGTLGVESEVGRGSRFWFNVPFKKPFIHKVLAAPECWDARPKRLYLVRVNELSARLVRYYARMLPLHLEERSSPQGVWKDLNENGDVFTIVLLDSSVPDLEVAALAKLLEDHNLNPATRLVQLTEPYSHFRHPPEKLPGRILALHRPIKRAQFLQLMDPGAPRQTPGSETWEPARSDWERAPAGASVEQGGKSLSILMVDDQEVNRVVLLKHLEALGLSADVAVHGPAALKRFQNNNYDLILLDCRTPGLEGLETARQIRELERQREIRSGQLLRPAKIVALTADGSDGDFDACIAAGMDACLAKPFNKENLRTIIANTVQTMNSESETSGENPILNPRVLESIRDLAPGDNHTFCEVVDLYLKNAADHLSELRDCCERGDLKQAQRLLHSFKGGSRNIGADRLASMLEACEGQFEGFTVETFKHYLDEFREEFSRVQEILAEEKGK